MSGELKPCPFCGKPGHIAKTEWGSFAAGCLTENCPAEKGAYDFVSAETAAAHWNNRATPTQDTRDPVKVLEEFVREYVRVWEAGTGTVYLIDRARTALGNKETDRG